MTQILHWNDGFCIKLPFSLYLRACLHGGRVTLLEGLPFQKGQKIAPLYMCRVIPRAISANKVTETRNHQGTWSTDQARSRWRWIRTSSCSLWYIWETAQRFQPSMLFVRRVWSIGRFSFLFWFIAWLIEYGSVSSYLRFGQDFRLLIRHHQGNVLFALTVVLTFCIVPAWIRCSCQHTSPKKILQVYNREKRCLLSPRTWQ